MYGYTACLLMYQAIILKKPMKECNGKEITAEWLYHLGIPAEEIDDLAANHANCTPTMMPYITAFLCQEVQETDRMLSRMAA